MPIVEPFQSRRYSLARWIDIDFVARRWVPRADPPPRERSAYTIITHYTHMIIYFSSIIIIACTTMNNYYKWAGDGVRRSHTPSHSSRRNSSRVFSTQQLRVSVIDSRVPAIMRTRRLTALSAARGGVFLRGREISRRVVLYLPSDLVVHHTTRREDKQLAELGILVSSVFYRFLFIYLFFLRSANNTRTENIII